MQEPGYIHTFEEREQERLVAQARFLEPHVFGAMDFSGCREVLEIGCGVGAEIEILLRRFPAARVTGIDHSEVQLARARNFLREAMASGRARLEQGSAYHLQIGRAHV